MLNYEFLHANQSSTKPTKNTCHKSFHTYMRIVPDNWIASFYIFMQKL